MKRVIQFTEAAGTPFPSEPRVATPKEVDFLCKMVIDETLEILSTVYDADDAKSQIVAWVCLAKDLPKEPEPTVVSFADGCVDIMIYVMNAAAKLGMDLDKVFDEVHAANMRKIDFKTGKVLRNAEGKILKPEGWVGPDVRKALYSAPPKDDPGAFVVAAVIGATLGAFTACDFSLGEPRLDMFACYALGMATTFLLYTLK